MIPFQAICTLIAVEHRAGVGAVGSRLGCCCFVAVPYIVRYVDDATTARFDSSYVIPVWIVSCMNTCGRASLVPSRRTALLVSSALAFPSASNYAQLVSQLVSNFTINSADSSARFALEISKSYRSNARRRPLVLCTFSIHAFQTPIQASLPSGLPPCLHRATMATADPRVACARRKHKDCALR